MRYDAILFDLLTALVDSWTLWNRAAGDEATGRRWRTRYLDVTYAAGAYTPYETLVMESAALEGVPPSAPASLLDRWDDIAPWPEAPAVLKNLRRDFALGVVTNCSNHLAARTVASLGVPLSVLVAAERAGAYKPDPRPYRLALRELGLPAHRVLFVAGSPSDIPGAMGVGMPVVWHNRLQLQRPVGSPAPLAEIHSLAELPRWAAT